MSKGVKNIEKSILSINMYDKTAEPAKLSKIKKLVGDYFKYKEDERIAVSQKIMKYDEQFKNVRERNNVEYELFLEKKRELYDIYKKNKALSSLYDYLNYKYTNSHQDTPDIYTYEYFNFNERVAVPKKPKAADEVPKKKPKVPKEPKEPKAKAPKVLKDCPEGQVRNPKTNRCIKEANYKKIKVV